MGYAITDARPTEPHAPAGTPIVQVFDQLNGALLILGTPGAGKTTMLLELARDLIARAEQDASQCIPVVFNLSSWSDKQTIDDWLIYELRSKYNVPKKLAESWVMQDELLLLLDGLDEVRAERRAACVAAINTFRHAHGMTPLVVCSRIADYQALTARLNLQGAVLLQPLTAQQIDEYLNRAGAELIAVRQTLQHDATLQELIQQPLMLGIMTLAYRGVSVDELARERLGTVEARRKHLFDAYIQQMFNRVARTKNELYTPAQTKHWLSWLAQKMIEQGQSIFLLQRLHWIWLPNEVQLILGVMAGLMFGLICGLVAWLGFGLGFGLVAGLICGLVFGLFVGPDFGLESEELDIRQPIKNAIRAGLVFGIGFVLVAGLVVGLICGLVGGLCYGGLAVLNHYILRLFFYFKNCMPLNYVRFLDYAFERIFLRKVGGGYVFVHRMLMEHFASLEAER